MKLITITMDGEVVGSNFDAKEAVQMAQLCNGVASQLLQQSIALQEAGERAENERDDGDDLAPNGTVSEDELADSHEQEEEIA